MRLVLSRHAGVSIQGDFKDGPLHGGVLLWGMYRAVDLRCVGLHGSFPRLSSFIRGLQGGFVSAVVADHADGSPGELVTCRSQDGGFRRFGRNEEDICAERCGPFTAVQAALVGNERVGVVKIEDLNRI